MSEERQLDDGAFIVSKTDTNGRITYANRTFQRLSGFSEKELLGHEHSIVRDPEMPRAIFRLMWEALKREEEFFVYIKSHGRDDSYYWGFATMIPSYDAAHQVNGYFSVRRKPAAGAVASISELYRAMCEEERRVGGDGGIDASTALLGNFLTEKGMSYAEYIVGLQT
jgi:PAS domain S-box-containing protein